MTYQICTNCIMDTSDSSIMFDSKGVCEYCKNFLKNILPNWHTDERGLKQLQTLSDKIKRQSKGKKFDCILGFSGGLDSSYTAYVAKEIMGLRPLLLHVDAGWNTEQAVSNIEKIVDGLGLELYTEVINWEAMRKVQVAFLRSQIPDQDLPQDAAFFSTLYKFARKNKIKYVLTGANFSTECCRSPIKWGSYPGIDKNLFNDIYKTFYNKKITQFPLTDILTYKIYYKYIFGMQVIHPLNLVPFIKQEAEELLHKRFGWQKFLHKHHESRFTRFYEDYWLPRKFGYDKRRSHFSSLIMTGQMSRENALARISRPELDDDFLVQEFEYIANKLSLSVSELRTIFQGQNSTYNQYKNKMSMINMGSYILQTLGVEKRLFK